MSSKVKNYLTKAGVIGSTFGLMAMNTFAAGDMDGIIAAMTTSMTQTKTDILLMIGIGVPIAGTLMGIILGIKKGFGFFKSLVNKAG